MRYKLGESIIVDLFAENITKVSPCYDTIRTFKLNQHPSTDQYIVPRIEIIKLSKKNPPKSQTLLSALAPSSRLDKSGKIDSNKRFALLKNISRELLAL